MPAYPHELRVIPGPPNLDPVRAAHARLDKLEMDMRRFEHELERLTIAQRRDMVIMYIILGSVVLTWVALLTDYFR
jgi:hypothetical protein